MLTCPNKGCPWIIKSEAGLLSHSSRCPFKRFPEETEDRGPIRGRKSLCRRRALPATLGGSAPRLPSDDVYVDIGDGSGEMLYEDTQERAYNEAVNVGDELHDMQIFLGDTAAGEHGAIEPEIPCLTEMTADDVAKSLALFLSSISRDLGASRLDRLLAHVQHPSYSVEATLSKYNSTATVRRYVANQIERDGGNLEKMGFKMVSMRDESGVNCKLYMRDPVEVLRCQLEKSSRQKMLYEHAREINRAGERIYNHPLSGKVAEEGFPLIIEEIMRSSRPDVYWDHSLNNFVGPVQLYADKSMATLAASSLTFYPLHITLLNFKNEFRRSLIQRGETKIAFLPVYMYDSGASAIIGRMRKMKVLHEALQKALEPLFKACWTGFSFYDKEMVPRRCYPCLGSIVADIPEAKDLTSTLHGNNTDFPCIRCLTRKEDLAIPSEPTVRLRTTADTLEVQKQVQALEARLITSKRGEESRCLRAECSKLLKTRSITSLRSSMSHWPFLGLHPTLDLYRALTFEPMHNLPLGVGKLLKSCLMLRLGSQELVSNELLTARREPRTFSSIKTLVLSSVNKALHMIQKESPSSNFSIDFQSAKVHQKLNGLYNSDGIVGMLEAADLSCIDQVFPFVGALVDRLCGEAAYAPTTKVSTMYSELVLLLYRRNKDPGHTRKGLEELQTKIRSFKEFACELYGSFQSSGMKTLKFHMLDHVVADIECFGSLEWMDAGVYESSHKEMKRLHKGTSRRKATSMDETVSAISESHALQRKLENPSNSSASTCFKEIAHFSLHRTKRSLSTTPTAGKLETIAGGCATLVQRGARILYTDMMNFLRSYKKSSQPSQPNREPKNLRDLVADVGIEGLRSFCLLLSAKACHEIEDIGESVQILSDLYIERVQSAYVASMDTPNAENLQRTESPQVKVVVQENGRRIMKRVVASHSFYGSAAPRMDCVMLEATENCQERENIDSAEPAPKLVEVFLAKALVLFRAKAGCGPLAPSDKEEREFVFLRYFDVIPPSDNVDQALGCLKLRWARILEATGTGEEGVRPWYDLQSIATLRGRVHVVRGNYCLDCTESYKSKSHWKDHWFYVNRFKYNSKEPLYYEEDIPGDRVVDDAPDVVIDREYMAFKWDLQNNLDKMRESVAARPSSTTQSSGIRE